MRRLEGIKEESESSQAGRVGKKGGVDKVTVVGWRNGMKPWSILRTWV